MAGHVGDANVDTRYRVWFNDNATHGVSADPNYAVDYLGIVQQAHTYKKAGTYYAVLNVASQRQGNAKTQFGLVQNLARVRVVVR